MKILSILSAFLVAVFVYVFIFERDVLLGVSSSSEASKEQEVDDKSTTKAPKASDAFSVVVRASKETTSQSMIIARGEARAARKVRVASETSGTVIAEPKRKGQFVQAGEIMCQLDLGTRQARLAESKARLVDAEGRIPEAAAAIKEAEARVDEAKVSLNAAEKLKKDGFASEARLVSAKAAYGSALSGLQRANSAMSAAKAGIEAALANVQTAQKEIERTTIRAPFGGILENDTAELGTLMQPSATCGDIIQLNPVKLVGFVTEAEVDLLSVGDVVQARFISGPSKEGAVSFIARSADPATRTFQIEVEIDNEDLSIRDGQTVEMSIAAKSANVHKLPQSALTLNDDGLLGVRAVSEQNKVVFYPVQMVGDSVEGVLLAGLPSALNVIVVGQEFVQEGSLVTPVFQSIAVGE